MIVPMKQPQTASIRVKGESAISKPSARFANSSMGFALAGQALREGDESKPQRIPEDYEQAYGQADPGQDRRNGPPG